jgi:CheY-like chemotaxis protein
VLVVDRNDTNQLVTTRMLGRLGYRAEVTGSGRDALLAITAFGYAAVLMDCQMPEMDGYETTRELRRSEDGTGRHLPVIAMSTADAGADREACFEAGMDHYLSKPVRTDALAQALDLWTPLEPEAGTARALDTDRFEALRELSCGDGDLLAAVIRTYLDEGSALLVTLREALAEGDPQSVERAARALKGASAHVGALGVSDACKSLETFARAGSLGTAPQLVDQAAAAFARARGALSVHVSTI